MTAEPIREALGLHRSMALCGEQPSERSEAIFAEAVKALAALTAGRDAYKELAQATEEYAAILALPRLSGKATARERLLAARRAVEALP